MHIPAHLSAPLTMAPAQLSKPPTPTLASPFDPLPLITHPLTHPLTHHIAPRQRNKNTSPSTPQSTTPTAMALRLHLIAILPRCCPHAPAVVRRAAISLSFAPKRGFTTTELGPRRQWEALWSSSRSRTGAVVSPRGSPLGVGTGKAMASSSSAGAASRTRTGTDRRMGEFLPAA